MTAALRRGGTDDAGFTLLELLVAMAVLGMVILLLTQGVRFGARATQLQAASWNRKGDLEAVDHALRRMVALAEPGTYPEPATLRGTAHAMSFTTELPVFGDGRALRADVTLAVEAGRLLLRWTPHRHVELFGARPPPQQAVLLDGVDRIELAFLGVGRWVSAWNAEKLPAVVRIRIVFPAASGRRWPPLLVAPLREALEE